MTGHERRAGIKLAGRSGKEAKEVHDASSGETSNAIQINVRLVAAAVFGAAVAATPAFAEKVLRVAMTAADVPLTTGQPSQGGEGLALHGRDHL